MRRLQPHPLAAFALEEFEEAELERGGYAPPTAVLEMMERAGGCHCAVDRMLAVIDRVEEDTAVMLMGERARGKCYKLMS